MQQEYFHLKTHEKSLLKGHRIICITTTFVTYTHRIGSTCVLTLTTVQYISLCPMKSSCSIESVIQLTIIVHVPPVQKYLNQRKWSLQKCLAVKRRPEHQELCIWSLRHDQFTVPSVWLLTRCVNIQAIEKTPKCKEYMNKTGTYPIFYRKKSFPLIM